MAALSPMAIVSTERKGKTGRNDWDTQHVVTLKHQFLYDVTIKRVLLIFYYQNNFETFCTSAIW
jgi:hypothetical protein